MKIKHKFKECKGCYKKIIFGKLCRSCCNTLFVMYYSEEITYKQLKKVLEDKKTNTQPLKTKQLDEKHGKKKILFR